MRELGDSARRLSEPAAVVEVAQCNGSRAHQSTVAGRVRPRCGVGGGLLGHHGTGPGLPARESGPGRPQHRAGLDADVGRVAPVPLEEAVSDLVEGGRRGEVGAGGGDPRDGNAHGGVVAPLAGREVAEASARHRGLDTRGRRGGELVGHAERVAGRSREQHSGRSVALSSRQLHPSSFRVPVAAP